MVVIPIVAGIGNALMAQPMVRQLKRGWGDARIIVMARLGAMGEIFSRMNEVEEVRPLGKSSAEILKNMWKVRGMKPYLFIAPFPSNRWQYSMLAMASGAERKLLHRYPVGNWRTMRCCVGENVQAQRGIHDVVQNLRLLLPLGIQIAGGNAGIFPSKRMCWKDRNTPITPEENIYVSYADVFAGKSSAPGDVAAIKGLLAHKKSLLDYVGASLGPRNLEDRPRGDPKDKIGLYSLLHAAAQASVEGRIDEAVTMARQALAQDPGIVEGHTLLGNFHAKAKRYDEAARAYRQALRLDPEHPGAVFSLALAYKNETFPKPRNIIGLAKDLPDAEMEHLILTHIEVADDDLRELATQRAQAVEDYLLHTGQLDADRIFLSTPKGLSPDTKDGAKDSRVDFALQ